VTSTSWEHQGEVRDALRTIIGDPQLGVPALSSSQTMANLLKDLLPDAPRETSLLVAAAEAGLPQVLQDHVAQGMDIGTACSLTSSAFMVRTPFTPEACTWVVGELAVALGLAPGDGPGQPAGASPAGQGGFGQDGFGQGIPGQGVPGESGFGQGVAGQGAPGESGSGPWGFGQGGFGQGAATVGDAGRGMGQEAAWAPPAAQHPAAGDQTLPPMGPGAMPADKAETQMAGGPGQPAGWGTGYPPVTPVGGAPPARGKPRTAALVTAAVVAVAVIAGIVVAVHALTAKPAPVEALTKIIRPDVTRCDRAGSLGMTGLTSRLACSTKTAHVYLNGYQFDTPADYRAGLAHLNTVTGWNQSVAGNGCPPPSGSSIGREGWHTLHDPRYKSARPDQILECYTDPHVSGLFLYLWTLPSQRVILLGGDSVSASYDYMQHWWERLTYA
jgi:hypothetical protein